MALRVYCSSAEVIRFLPKCIVIIVHEFSSIIALNALRFTMIQFFPWYHSGCYNLFVIFEYLEIQLLWKCISYYFSLVFEVYGYIIAVIIFWLHHALFVEFNFNRQYYVRISMDRSIIYHAKGNCYLYNNYYLLFVVNLC